MSIRDALFLLAPSAHVNGVRFSPECSLSTPLFFGETPVVGLLCKIRAHFAIATLAAVPSIRLVIGMTLRAVSDFRKTRSDGIAPERVLPMCHRLKMRRVHAFRNSAEVVKNQPFRNRANNQLIRNTVCALERTIHPDRSISRAFTASPDPWPALGWPSPIYFSPEPLFKRLFYKTAGGSVSLHAPILYMRFTNVD